MQRLRSLRQKVRYTQLANDAIDRLPSLESVGLLATILRHDDAFEFDMALLIKRKPNLGEKRAYHARRELINHGYLVQLRFQHTYRGRFGTDIFRAAEPHTADDLEELRTRYTPGAQIVITDDTGAERVETVTWAEMTSPVGVEQLGRTELTTSSGESSDASSVKPQVAPDRALPGSGTPRPGTPRPGTPSLGTSGSFKEDCPLEHEQEPPPSGPTSNTQLPDTEQTQEVGEDVSTEIWDMLTTIPIPDGKRAPGRRSKRLADVAARCAAILKAADQYGLRLRDLRQHLAADLDTVRHSITAVWLHRLADSELPSPSQVSTPASTVPPVCGQCDARDGDGVAARIIIMTDAHGTERGQKCPRCHPHAATEQQESSTALTSSETNVGEMLGQMMAGKSLGAAPND